MNNKEPAKPCPFCGSVQVAILTYNLGFRVRCLMCNAIGPRHIVQDEAIDRWNERSSGSPFEEYVNNEMGLPADIPRRNDLADRWASLPPEQRMMIGYIVGGLAGLAIRRLWEKRS